MRTVELTRTDATRASSERKIGIPASAGTETAMSGLAPNSTGNWFWLIAGALSSTIINSYSPGSTLGTVKEPSVSASPGNRRCDPPAFLIRLT